MKDLGPGLVVGWRRRTWETPVECVACIAMITAGTTHVRDDNDPPAYAMCDDCYKRLMEDPEHFEDTPAPAAQP